MPRRVFDSRRRGAGEAGRDREYEEEMDGELVVVVVPLPAVVDVLLGRLLLVELRARPSRGFGRRRRGAWNPDTDSPGEADDGVIGEGDDEIPDMDAVGGADARRRVVVPPAAVAAPTVPVAVALDNDGGVGSDTVLIAGDNGPVVDIMSARLLTNYWPLFNRKGFHKQLTGFSGSERRAKQASRDRDRREVRHGGEHCYTWTGGCCRNEACRGSFGYPSHLMPA